VDKKYGDSGCKMYSDQYELLARGDIDAVLIATGDRWHTPLSIIAAQHGKDVYCEKPCSMSMEESWALADAFRRYNRLYQAGCQRRNGANFQLCKELLRSGALGKLEALYANTGPSVNWPPLPSRDWLAGEDLPPKQVLDWDRWLGPAPWRPYHSSYVRGGWRNFYDFHGGGILEWGSHTVDLCQWAHGSDGSAPTRYDPDPDGNTIHARYADGVKLVLRRDGWLGLGTCPVRFVGDEGWVETGDSGEIEVHPASLKSELKQFETVAGLDVSAHARNFFDCMRSRSQTAANPQVMRHSHIACHAASLSWILNRKLTFDPAKEAFVNDDEANSLRSRPARDYGA